MVRADVRYEGRVQGVGFRATARHLSQNYEVTGFVRNEMDGSVRLVAEGEQAEVDSFLNEILDSRLGRTVTDVRRRPGEPTGRFRDFSISA